MTSTNTQAKAKGAASFEVVEVDPASLIIGTNVRLDARVDADLVSSIRERGVLQPIVAYRDDEGRLVVLMGQRRTLASVQTERPSVPVVVVPKPAEDARLIDQMAENDHRTALTTAERVEAFSQLALLGMSAAQIAKKAATKREDVDAALTASKSATARASVEQAPTLTLAQAATLAEFEDDEQAVAALVDAATRGGFEHTAQRLRDQRAEAQAKTRAAEEQATRGITVVDMPAWDDEGTKRLSELKGADGQPIDATEHETCPGHAVFLSRVSTAYAAFVTDDDCTCEAEDPEDCTCEPADDEADEEASGPRFQAVAVCREWRTHGHALRYGATRTRAADMTPAERDAKARERRLTIARNKEADSAQIVRREWLATLATRKTAPRGGPAFMATILTRYPSWVDEYKTAEVLGAIFGIEAHRTTDHLAGLVAKASDARAAHLALVRVLAAIEATVTRDSWKWTQEPRVLYLTTLAGWGYDLAPIEQRMAGLDTTDETDEQDAAEEAGPEAESAVGEKE